MSNQFDHPTAIRKRSEQHLSLHNNHVRRRHNRIKSIRQRQQNNSRNRMKTILHNLRKQFQTIRETIHRLN